MSWTPTIIAVRKYVYDAIVRQQNALVIPDLDIVETYYPKTKVQEMVKPKISLVSMQWSEDKLTRSNARELELPVQVAIQQHVNPTDTPTIDLLICLVEQVNKICAEVCIPDMTWLRTEPLSDPNNTPFSFLELHEQHLFQATFTVYYKAAVC